MAALADRHLLLGLLALQNGLVQQNQLVTAFLAWTADKGRPLADHMIALGHLNQAQRRALEAMTELHVEAHDGDLGRSLAAVPAAPSTREKLHALGDRDVEATLSHVGSTDAATDADRTGTYPGNASTLAGRRYRILRPHAQGGLGAVFVALDAELNREVALKRILEKHADDEASRHRFLLEAEITGGLEHPGIVPVYGLGTYDDGRPYYAMRFVRGDSMKEAIESFHAASPAGTAKALALRQLLRRFVDVCNAIEYAHSRGVIHRDIKPSNVIVGNHGETLVVDWGLAKALGKSAPTTLERTLVPGAAGGSSETLPGEALGTPAYMAPEQASGDLERVGPRSDVYSLGATLYALLTGKAPFEGDVVEVLQAVRRGRFQTPRSVEASIDKALEAVCLKAMATDPEDRYSSCRALAEDIERWMADGPVTAYREPWTRTLTRWLTRHRTSVTGFAAAGLALLLGLAAVAVVQARGRTDLMAKNAELGAANRKVLVANRDLEEANEKTRRRYELAVEAVRTFHTGVSQDVLLKEDQFKDLRHRLLKSAADFYERLGGLLRAEPDHESRKALLAANYEVANLTAKVAKPEDALAIHERVLGAREGLAGAARGDKDLTLDLIESLETTGSLMESLGRGDEALACFERARSFLTKLDPPPPGARALKANCEFLIGQHFSVLGKRGPAMEHLGRARAIREEMVAANPDDDEARRAIGVIRNEIAVLHGETGTPEKGLEELRSLRDLLLTLLEKDPTSPERLFALSQNHKNMSFVLGKLGRAEEALAEAEQARDLQRRIVAAWPAITSFRRQLAISENGVGVQRYLLGRAAEALEAYRTALATFERLSAETPGEFSDLEHMAIEKFNISEVLADLGDDGEALKSVSEAGDLFEQVLAKRPTGRNDLIHLATGLDFKAKLLRRAGRLEEARVALERAVSLRVRLAEAGASDQCRALATTLQELALVLGRLGRKAEAESRCREVVATLKALDEADPNALDLKAATATALQRLGEALRRLDRLPESRAVCEQAVAILEGPEFAGPSRPPGLSVSRLSLALTQAAMGDLASAAREARKALAYWEELPSRSADDWFESARAHAVLSQLAGREGPGGVAKADGPTHADASIESLRRAIAEGLRDRSLLRTDEAFAPLRDREDLKALITELEKKSGP